METSHLTSESVQNYLKAIYHLDPDRQGATAQALAASLGVSGPGVTKMLQYLDRHQLVEYARYQPVRLTPVGERIALEVIRHHRLLERYLVESLGYGWERVHAEAERMEHHISEDFEDCIERLLGFPTHDPHGDPIPTRDGIVPARITTTLEDQARGADMVVRRVDDEDPELLLYLGERGLRPGTPVRLVDREPFGGSLHLAAGGREVSVSPQAARHVFVELAEPGRE